MSCITTTQYQNQDMCSTTHRYIYISPVLHALIRVYLCVYVVTLSSFLKEKFIDYNILAWQFFFLSFSMFNMSFDSLWITFFNEKQPINTIVLTLNIVIPFSLAAFKIFLFLWISTICSKTSEESCELCLKITYWGMEHRSICPLTFGSRWSKVIPLDISFPTLLGAHA